jgi:hypothetical protein
MKQLFALLLCAVSVFADQGTEFTVNARRAGVQRDAQAARDRTNTVLIVWCSENHTGPASQGDVVLRRLTLDPATNAGASNATAGISVGVSMADTEMVVHDPAGAGDQEKPALAANLQGMAVVVWASMTNRDSVYDIKARRFLDGMPQGPEFFVNTTMPRTQTEPDVAMDATGNFVVVWDGWTAGDDRDVYLRVFGPDGTPRTGEVRVNSTTAYSQARPAVRYRPDGSVVVGWESWLQDATSPAGYGVYARVFDAIGVPLTAELPVNTWSNDYQWYADVESFSDNTFAVVWCSWEQDGADGGIFMQRFNADGSKRGTEIQVNTTTAYYQWLPRIQRNMDDSFAVCWSSWKQDGSREGVFLQSYDAEGRRSSFESPVNTRTESYQWEPDIAAIATGDMLIAWSDWQGTGTDYEITARRVRTVRPEGVLRPSSVVHAAGRTTSRVVVHVIDSLALTGHAYEATLDSLANRTAALHVRDLATGDSVVRRFALDRGENIFYLTPVFHGVAVEVVPEFDLELDLAGSFMIRHSATNLAFAFNPPSAGTKKTAPIDVALIWGSTDTLADGRFASPLDTALGINGKREVVVPFRGWNLTDNQRMDLLVTDSPSNKRWDPGDRIVFLTPVAYRSVATNTHAEVRPTIATTPAIWPGPGDTTVVLTIRPIANADRFTFTTSRAAVLEITGGAGVPGVLTLSQNYPNPFNPATTIRYTVPAAGHVTLKVYSILGQEVRMLASGFHQPGTYRVQFEARGLASGVYFYALEGAGRAVVRKMLVVK